MSGPGRQFDPSELRIPGQPEPSAAESADALAAARELEALAASEGIRPTEGFAERVMSAIATEPAPRLVVRPRTAIRGGRPAALIVALREAWGVAMSGGRPMAVRAQALAFVLLVVVAAGSLTTVAAVGVGGFLSPHPSPSIAPAPTTSPIPTSSAPMTPSPSTSLDQSPDPGVSGEPTDSAEPSETPQATDTAEPTETRRATDTAEPTETPDPKTQRPPETAKPGETPEASDGGGGGGGGDSGGGDSHGGGGGGGGGG